MSSSPHTSPFMSSWLTAEDDDDGWDLYAVVRSCRPASAPAAALPPPAPCAPLTSRSTEALLPSHRTDLKPTGNSLHELCKPFHSATQPRKFHLTSTSASPAPRSQVPRSKRRQGSSSLSVFPLTFCHRNLILVTLRRKNQQKRMVCQVVADALSGDLWAWRKYGQKPIKGSPYPRGYYRCSSSKGCLARKQVERSRTDAGMFVITYSGEHNHPLPTHRNSLAGSTRQKFPASGEAGVGLSPNTPLPRARKTKGESTDEEEEGDEGELDVLLVEDMEVVGDEEVLFMGFEEFEGSSSVAVDGFLEWDGGLGRNDMEKAMHD